MSIKRLPLLFLLIAFLSLALSTASEAQGRRGGGGGGGSRGSSPAPRNPAPRGQTVAPRGGRAVVVAPRYYAPYYRSDYRPYYSYFYADPFWYGYPWFGYSSYGYAGYGYAGYQYPGPYGGYPYGYRYADRDSSVRLEVTPRDAEVFVDGYYAGIVDDFDGVFQRLHVPPAQHEIALYREGYRTVHQTVYLTTDSTFKIKYTMEKLGAGDVAEPRPTPSNPPPDAFGPGPDSQGQPPQGPPQQGPPPQRGVAGRRVPPPPPPGPPNSGAPRGGQASSYGTLAIRVQPADATVTIDGERWAGPQGQDRLLVEVAEGNHRVQIQKDGFDTFSTEITVRRGDTTPLNVSLRTR